MAEEEVRCPHCNGTGQLPTERAKHIEHDRDESAVILHHAGLLWAELADLFGESRKKSITLETLQSRIKSAYSRMGKILTLGEKVGHRT